MSLVMRFLLFVMNFMLIMISNKRKFMVIKTDMSKAYDRVERPFIEQLLLKMGICEKWVSWMMWCVPSV